MKLFIHDLEERNFQKLFPNKRHDNIIISDRGKIHHCIGCFGCWIKTPGNCIIDDDYKDMGELFSKCEEVIIISKCIYGSYSPFIKNILDRSISYIHPYFVIRNGEMHHRRRYNNKFNMKVWFYGKNMTEEEKQTANALVKANSYNLDCTFSPVEFFDSINEMEVNIK
ncbi:flavodoxin family protein [Haloimpatiens sp. FM7315]|uniref:flavodoxin family protein n=1 Tax=Haloimpatiens sp. FM7315 TaxID=3298609 RepID=UPI0035A33FB6